MSLKCPKCDAMRLASGDQSEICSNCGIVFAKYDPEQATALNESLQRLRQQGAVAMSNPQDRESLSFSARYEALEALAIKRSGLGIGAWILLLLVAIPIGWLYLTQARTPKAEPKAEILQARQILDGAARAQHELVQTAIREGRVVVGMGENQVREAWGNPDKKNRTENGYGTEEQWVYPNGRYVYLHNGLVRSIQTSN